MKPKTNPTPAETQTTGSGTNRLPCEPDFLSALARSTVETFRIQANTPVQSRPAMPRNAFQPSEMEIAAVVEIDGNGIQGSLSLHFGQRTLLGVVGLMMGEVCNDIDADITSAVTELLNIIYTNAKVALNAQGYGLESSIPQITSVKALESDGSNLATVLPFDSPVGVFRLELFLDATRTRRLQAAG